MECLKTILQTLDSLPVPSLTVAVPEPPLDSDTSISDRKSWRYRSISWRV